MGGTACTHFNVGSVLIQRDRRSPGTQPALVHVLHGTATDPWDATTIQEIQGVFA